MQSIFNQSIIKNSSYINGEWLDSQLHFEVVNPANREIIAHVCEVQPNQIEIAINSAYDALSSWQQISPQDRAQRLNRWQELLRDNLDDLARLLTLEQGKPLVEARAEVLHSAEYTKIYSNLAEDLLKPFAIGSPEAQSASVVRRPIGVVSAISPWNFPCSMVLRKAAGAMAAGCTVVLKPSELTPLSALAIAKLSQDADIPAGVFNVLVGSNAQAIGEFFCQHPKVAKLSFTGSTKVGKKLLVQCAEGVKRTSMELGGSAPFIVFSDADIEQAVDGAMASKFRNAGQTCVSANRFLVQQDILPLFKSKLIEKIKLLVAGNGLSSTVTLGPLINDKAVKKIVCLVERAIEQGAKKVYSASRLELSGYFFEPLILEGVTPKMDLFHQEIFGPVVSLTSFDSEQQAIELANCSELGLCGYVYTSDQERAVRLSSQLELGMLGINQARLSNPAAPFGGVKQSGMGREGGRFGIEEYLDYQYICQPKTPA